MRLNKYFLSFLAAIMLLLLGTAFAADPAASGTTSVIVTAEARKGGTPATQKKDRLPVTEMTPLAGTPVELYIAVDETIGSNFGTQLGALTQFVKAQPANVAVGIAYLHDGTMDIRQTPTTNHAAAAKRLGLPTQGLGTSTFESVTDLVKQWPQSQARRELILISTGIEPFGTNNFSNPFVDEAVAAVQRQGIPVFAIYLPPAGHWGHTYWRKTLAQTYLSQIADESGGEGYNISVVAVSIGPHLDSINRRLQNQYRIAFTPKAPEKPGFVPIRAETEVPNVDLVTQDRVWVGGAE